MSIRVGESWQARNGHRRWMSMSGGDLLFGLGVWAVIVGPFLALWWLFLAELWLAAEARPGDVRLTRLRWGLFMVDLKGGKR